METIRLSRADRIAQVLENKPNGVATLKELYTLLSDMLPHSLREAIYRDKKKRFKQLAKGVWALKGEQTTSLLIEGNGRDLEEIEDNSIDAIITDHPWLDKKAHKSGNQKNFAEYDAFRYTQEDFDAKARVLKDGAYCVEFVPVESFSNYEYLYELKQMAKKAGLNYYAKITWQKTPVNAINTGRTTKGVEDIMVFYKGKKPRILSRQEEGKARKAYSTTEILPWRVEFPVKANEKTHQAMKPIELYEFLIKQFTREEDICLDQFGGSCNLLQATTNTNRFGIVYELCSKFVKSAVDRFNCIQLFNPSEDTLITEEQSPQEESVELLEVSMELACEEATVEPQVELPTSTQDSPKTERTDEEKRLECQLFVQNYFNLICDYDEKYYNVPASITAKRGWEYLQKTLNLSPSVTSFEQLEVEQCKAAYYQLLPILKSYKLR